MTRANSAGAEPLCYDDVSPGDKLPQIVIGPVSSAHLVRWCGAIENWHRIHYDTEFAKEHEGLPERLVNGSWKQHLLVRLIREWTGLSGWLARLQFQFRGMDRVGDTLTIWGEVTEVQRARGHGLIQCLVGIRNQHGEDNTRGVATVALPFRDGPAVLYPYDDPGPAQ